MSIDLYVEKVDASIVSRKWLHEIANNIADEYDDDTTVDYDKLYQAVDEECERFICYPTEALTLILRYGWSDAVVGNGDYYDSPMFRFKRDVFEVTRYALEDKGIEIVG